MLGGPLSTRVLLLRALHHHCHPVPHHNIHHHIEMVGESESPCVTPLFPLKSVP